MLLIELSIKLQKDFKTRKKCMKLIKMAMLLFLKLKNERKIKRKLKLLDNNLNKSKKKHQNNKKKKVFQKDKQNKVLYKEKKNNKNLPKK